MSVPRHHIGFKGDECQCGRRGTLIHCLKCGSSRCYARLRQYHTHMDGSVKLVENQFRCQTCGHTFIEEEREWCNAPPVGQVLAMLKVRALREAAKASETLTPHEEKAVKSVEALLPTEEASPAASLKDDLTSEWVAETTQAFRTLVFQHKQLYLLLKEQAKLPHPEMSMQEYLEAWIIEEGISIPEGESL
jgi:hypothetical protein